MHSIFTRSLRINRVAPLHLALLMTLFLPTIARAQSTALEFIPVTPCRVVDTRNATGDFGGPELAAGSTRTFNIPQSTCGIPSTAVAYSLNATVLPMTHLGYITIWADDQTKPYVSTLNSYDGRTKSNAAITAAGTDGGVSVYASDATQFVLDINGYFVPIGASNSSLQFYPVTPCRIADTRYSGGALAAGASRSFAVQSSSCGIPSTAQAYSLNITALPPGPLNNLTAWPTGQSQPTVATLEAPTGTATANAAIVSAGSSGHLSVYVSDSSNVVVDVNGYFAPPSTSGLSYYAVTECRMLDTRYGLDRDGPFQGTLNVPMRYDHHCVTPASVQAYVLNATVAPVSTLGYLTLWPDPGTQPNVSTLNAYDGAITSNMAIVPNIYGVINAYASNSTQLFFDLSGYFAP